MMKGEEFMANLLKETLALLEYFDMSFADIKYICGNDFQITKDDFVKLANIEYDSGYGAQIVAEDLKLIGKNFWFERTEYDGAESWEFKKIPSCENLPIKKIESLMCGYKNKRIGWHTLSEINSSENY